MRSNPPPKKNPDREVKAKHKTETKDICCV